MDSEAIAKAKKRVARASIALEAIRNATTLAEMEVAWTDYLLAHNSTFTVLEQGAKVSPQSRQWFGGIKRTRRGDPLLNYLHQARNADEHDIPSIVERRLAGGITFGEQPVPPGHKITKVGFVPAGGKETVLLHDENGLSNVTALRPVMVLLRVFDSRFSQSCDPPKEHLGRPLNDPGPIGVAELGLNFLTNLVAQAEGLVR